MIYKSYLIEQDISALKNNFTLFYGENLGLKNDFIKIIKKKILILNFKNTHKKKFFLILNYFLMKFTIFLYLIKKKIT